MQNKQVKICGNVGSILHIIICIYIIHAFCIQIVYIIFMMYTFCRSELMYTKFRLYKMSVYKMDPTFRRNFVYILFTKHIQKFLSKCGIHFCVYFVYIFYTSVVYILYSFLQWEPQSLKVKDTKHE